MSRGEPRLARLRRLPRREQLVVLEAAVVVCAASMARRFAPPRSVHRLLTWVPRAPRRSCAVAPERLVALVDAAGAELPLAATCLDRALAARWMLARRGVDARLVIGASTSPRFSAHSWLDLSGTVEDVARPGVLWHST